MPEHPVAAAGLATYALAPVATGHSRLHLGAGLFLEAPPQLGLDERRIAPHAGFRPRSPLYMDPGSGGVDTGAAAWCIYNAVTQPYRSPRIDQRSHRDRAIPSHICAAIVFFLVDRTSVAGLVSLRSQAR